ncbi:MAG: glycosyltransferase [Alphaproteobacteria bacterium]|nr:glycosyltransferase [Alphaproteobacteria bacterium]
MSEARVTLVVIQRERFSATRRSLESIYRNTRMPFKLVYVDSGSPGHIRRYLARQSRERDFHLIRVTGYLSPCEARNLGFRAVHTPYVVFMDNDVIVSEGWLENMVACADETGAWGVSPIYLQGEPEDEIVHHAGGRAYFRMVDGKKHFFEKHLMLNKPLAEIRPKLQRQPTEMLEFHVMLVRADAFRRVGMLDEGFLSQYEHIDLCLRLRDAGGELYHEPRAVVTYLLPRLLWPSDVRLFLLRWSEAWNLSSLRHFQIKYGVADNCKALHSTYRWLTSHRRNPFRRLLKPVRVLFGKRAGEVILDGFERLLTPRDDTRIRYHKADVPWQETAWRAGP